MYYLVFYNFVNASFITLYGTVTWLDDFFGFFPFVTGRSKLTVYIADKLRSILISFEIENNTCILHFNVMRMFWPVIELYGHVGYEYHQHHLERGMSLQNHEGISKNSSNLRLNADAAIWEEDVIFFPTEKVKEVVGYSRFDQIRCLSIHGKRLACKRICTYPSCKKDKRSSFIGRRMYKIWWRCGKC